MPKTKNRNANTLKIFRKQMLFSIALILLLAISGIMMSMPASKAQTEASPLPTHAFLAVSPNPVGVNQQVTLIMWLEEINPTASGPSGGRWQDFTVLMTKPDKTTQTFGPLTANDASFAVTTYTPTQIGNYTFTFSFPGQHVTGVSALYLAPVDSYYGASNFTTTLTVQEQPATIMPQAPLPTEYWQNPVNAQNQNWYTISGNWLAIGIFEGYGNFQQYSTGPDSAHIVWTKPLMDGGLIGGEFGGTDTSNYYTGQTYEQAFTPPVILNGVLYYNSPTPPREGFYAVDLRTGQTLWYQNSTGSAYLSSPLVGYWGYAGITLGQVYNYISPNQEGGLPYLWYTSGSTWNMYDANTGNLILQIANATSGTMVEGPNGELLEYILSNGYLEMWNSSLCIGTLGNYVPITTNFWCWRPPIGAVLDWSAGVQWNVTTQNYPGQTISKINSGVILASTGNPLSGLVTSQLEIGYDSTTGQQLWVQNRTYPSPGTGFNYMLGPMNDGIYTAYDASDMQWYAFSAQNGSKLWGPTVADTNPWGSELEESSTIAYGILYGLATDGIHAFNLTTGQKLWDFTGISSGLNFPGFSTYPFESTAMTIADGKIYVSTGISHGNPLFRGAQLYCVNATSGALLWSVNDYCEGALPIADGYLVAQNSYDNQLYCYGKGQSATTVTTSPFLNNPAQVLIKGTVTDQSPGQTCLGIPAAGTPAISDASMTQWMEYLYMQQPEPMNATGVPVTLSYIDPNGNTYTMGTTTSNIAGQYSYAFTPTVPGTYTIIATFGGSNSYYSSTAQTTMGFDPPTATAAPTATPTSVANLYFVPAVIAIIVVIIIGFALLAILSLRKRP